MPAQEYWQRRFLKDKTMSVNDAEQFLRNNQKKIYEKASKEITEEIEKFYKKYADDNKISLSEARKKISAADFKNIDWDSYCQYSMDLSKELLDKKDTLPESIIADMEKEYKEHEKKIKTLAAKGNVTRLEILQADIENTILKTYDANQISIYDYLSKEYEDGYYKGIFNIQKAIGYGKNFAAVNENAIEKVLLGQQKRTNFSKNLYNHQKNLIREIKECLTVGMIRGETMNRMASRVHKRINVSYSNARRLVRTETAYAYEQAMFDSYKECGIERYQYMATLDNRTSDICQELDGQEFNIKDAMPGKNYPPMHPNCRSTTVAVFDDEKVTERIAKRPDGKYYSVPSNMAYKEWKEKHISEVPDDIREYVILDMNGNIAPVKERRNFHSVYKSLQPKVKKTLKNVNVKTGSPFGNGYSASENTIYIVNGAGKKEITHEIGHAIEKLFSYNELRSMKKSMVQGLGAEDILIAQGTDDSGNVVDNIFLVYNDKFIDKYQGRIYADSIEDCLDAQGNIDVDKMDEIVSVAYSYYVNNPKTMHKYFPEMYEFIRNGVE